MNKMLRRLLKQITKKIKPTLSAWIIRAIAQKAEGARTQHELRKKIKMYGVWMARNLRWRGQTAEKTIAQFLEAVEVLAEIWTLVFSELWKSFRQPRIRLLCWLNPSLHNDQVPEKIDIVLEEVKCRLLEEYWPPTRQRCDSIALRLP